MQPSVKMFLTQAVYEYIVAKYLTTEERDQWEEKLSQENNSSKIVAEFIQVIETKAGKSIKELVDPIQSIVVDDTANTITSTMINILALEQQKTKSTKID